MAARDFQCQKFVVKIQKLLMFVELWAATGVKGYMSRGHLCKSGHETLGSSAAMHTPDAAQQILSEMANRNLKKVNFWCVDEGALPPMTPINPYLGGNMKKWATF